MSSGKSPDSRAPAPKTEPARREARLAKALRDNLRRRKPAKTGDSAADNDPGADRA